MSSIINLFLGGSIKKYFGCMAELSDIISSCFKRLLFSSKVLFRDIFHCPRRPFDF